MAADEDVVALVVQRDDLPSSQFGLVGEEGAHEVGGQEAEGGGEVVEDEFGGVGCGVAVAGEAAAFDPVCEGEVEGWAVGEVGDCEACWSLLVFFEDEDGGVFAAWKVARLANSSWSDGMLKV